jgi:hypothetical protein
VKGARVNGPVAALYRVSLGFKGHDDDRPVMPTGACQSFVVVAKDAEAAVARARQHVRDKGEEDERTCVVSVELVEGIDAL